MGTLYLVRHGQASFGAENYDVLSSMGHRQSVRLGEYFKSKGLTFDAALTGTLNRQIQTFAGICEGMGTAPDALRQTGLNEYDAEAVIAAIHPAKLEKPTSPEMVRSHFRLLKDGLAQWMAGVVSPRGMPSYTDFVAGITGVLDHVKTSYTGNVLLVSSGGPIATAVGHVLGTSPEATIDLNLRIRNCSLTEFAFTPKRHMLVTYNTLPHLDAPEHADWITYS
ncbi:MULTISPECIES: histidine phosphatase family protein [unclassified Polaromonas]|jgi:broad specificity phosphatase PhoE|uniref:histidine phosphatase family protein n=1 Tax=unclassified Polaromonas TaxID=2638319 RepID=UPI000BD52BE8|nr:MULTISPECIES: histidine phosphatase family protein [unclassified Polaromonas]OYY34331.1 MAG: histidine phosphatase family protein [Polaromonas sp. 35-63-35]OYZ17831.1 MAG: histidine phosphatase family protein [Polaromonas sp. 16-63-31]OYZ77229.1 MAG: histidine phosphatase family protein [Polaromonas sp. 24-63-21]OZA48161.1 MAG: histidine phosphatase family protein [Polaromonas sp. 17-63-33]OZA86687.1 MAG: histidine phosphatase family protein [Polaromonas sp. 39-63-25]